MCILFYIVSIIINTTIKNNKVKGFIEDMKKSPPKIVRINLDQHTKKYNTSPNKKYKTNSPKQFLSEFSFSNQYKVQPEQGPMPLYKIKKFPNIAKKLFKFSPIKPYENYGISPKGKSKSKQKNIINEHYEKIDEKDKLFKNSVQQLKQQFFKDSQKKKINQKQLTIKTLKQIGRYASNKSNEKILNKNQKQKSPAKKDIKVQFYGFKQINPDLSQHEKFMKKDIHQAPNTYKDTSLYQNKLYIDLQEQYNQELQKDKTKSTLQDTFKNKIKESHPKKLSNLDISPQKITYSFQNITEANISLIYQIFQFCEKGEEGDTFVASDLYNLLAELEKLYFIKVIQQKQGRHEDKKQSNITQREYQALLKEFEDNFKMIFYRKHRNNMYDAIFYLSEDNKLDTICQIFLQIKGLLSI